MMWRCDSCERHVLRVAPVCPFCAATRIAAFGLAVATPIVLSACYGSPGWDPQCDQDGDGWGGDYCSTDAVDCDDDDPAVNPGAEEICDNDIDDDCDGISAGTTTEEVCDNGLDDDCDGEVDELDCTPAPSTGDTGSTADTAESTGDTGQTTGDTGTTDTGAPAFGGLDLDLYWSAGIAVGTCAEAGLDAVAVTVDPPGPDLPHVCDDAALSLADLPVGAHTLVVRGTSTDGVRTWDSGAVDVEVLPDQTVAVPIVLVCSSTTTGACGP